MLISELPSALERFDRLESLLVDRRPAVFLDYDGTLTPIAAQPDQALLSPETRAALQRLAGLCPVSLVSGRELSLLRRLVGVEGVIYAAEHGFDILLPDGRSRQPPEVAGLLPHVEAAEAALRARLAAVEGLAFERKRFSLAIHYRHVAPAQVAEVEAAIAEVLLAHPQIKAMAGKKVFELQPAIDWNKGRAIVSLMIAEELPADSLPIFLGDDVTDETAFQALEDEGICIVLEGDENRETAARLRLTDSGEVRRYLQRLADLLDA